MRALAVSAIMGNTWANAWAFVGLCKSQLVPLVRDDCVSCLQIIAEACDVPWSAREDIVVFGCAPKEIFRGRLTNDLIKVQWTHEEGPEIKLLLRAKPSCVYRKQRYIIDSSSGNFTPLRVSTRSYIKESFSLTICSKQARWGDSDILNRDKGQPMADLAGRANDRLKPDFQQARHTRAERQPERVALRRPVALSRQRS